MCSGTGDQNGLCLVIFVEISDTLRIAAGCKLAVMIGKDIEEFPENSDRLTGTIDIWWIVRILDEFICSLSAS